MAAATLAAVAVLTLVACGGKAKASSSSTPPTPEFVYNSTCSTCHGVDGRGLSGPDLTGPDLTRATIDTQVRQGKGRMPAFEGRLSDAAIALAVDRVVELRQKAGMQTP